MTPPPRFSVIIATYQSAGTIERAIESALAQTVLPEEVLVCDDGSTDDTAGVVRRRFGALVTVVQQPNKGALAARNAVARLAIGDWLVVLDADDWWEPNRLDEVARCIATASDDVDVVTTDAVLELADGTMVGRYYDTISFPLDDQSTRLLTGNFMFGGAAIRRSRFMQLGGYTENWPDLSEGELWLRLSLTGSRLQLVAEPLCHYVLSSTQMTSDRTVVARHQMAGLQMILESGLLDDRQLRIAESEVSRLRSVLVAIVARQAVVERRSRARRGAFAAARSGGLTFRQRCSLLTMSVVPATAAHIWSTPLERQVAHGKDSIRPRSSS